ncbi:MULTISPECIES: hypothetical protein [Rhizobium]|jgi:hypothetical protein|uniref:hypothetical protein n=1 Tax=Rhizobium TaxID=379 RepID=UPI0009EBBD0E|nr:MULTISPECIES: hypothetical protein [unclassified Rhizobium]MBD9455156.1 hypothetical protein [Rhizobium sp. RHZ02]NMN73322.1 hypothetical protein [Rhizobium sp. 57MFTsu3.2]
MKRLIIAMAGLAAVLVSAPADAQGVYFEFGSGGHRYYDDSPPPRYYRYGPRYRDYDYDGPRYARRDVCWRVPYQHRSHHHYITRYRTVCE